MLLNKLPALDKGFVAYIDSSGNSDKLKQLSLEWFRVNNAPQLSSISTLTLMIKCPLFVQLNLSTHNFNIITVPPQDSLVEVYVPNASEIGSPDHETNKIIADDISRTAEALLINPKAYQQDGCERFTSQLLSPVSTYTTLIVHGSFASWNNFVNQRNLPASITSYVELVKQVMHMEWK